MRPFFSTREVADLLGVDYWRVQRLFQSGALSETARFAGKRTIPREMLPAILDALRARGWLPNEEPPR